MGRFVPVSDPEKARSEQDENSLRKHRQFDTPHNVLKKDLNEKRTPKGDMQPMGRPSGELEQDDNKLWRKKQELFEKEKTWGRETFQMGNQEQANVDGKKTRDVMAEALFGRAIGFKGGRGADDGDKVIQRSEVDQTLVKNEKGLWVRKEKSASSKQEEEEPLTGDDWRCPKCRTVNIRKRHLCKECQFDRNMIAEESGLIRAPKKGEDPRLEAAAKKGRGGADAAAEALAALKARRTEERHIQDDMGLTRAPPPERSKGKGKKDSFSLNSSAMMVQPSRRHQKSNCNQGVQRSAEEARKVVEKALGTCALADSKPSASSASSSKLESQPPQRGGGRRSPCRRSRSPVRKRVRDCSLSLSVSRSGSNSPPRESGEDVTVDFF